MRLTYFLTLLKNADFIIGNSSAGIREAPFYGCQLLTLVADNIKDLKIKSFTILILIKKILETIKKSLKKRKRKSIRYFGDGKSALIFKNYFPR